MTENVENLVLEQLRAIRVDIALIKADTAEIKDRLRAQDSAILDLRRSDVHGFEEQARQQLNMERLENRVARIERRLELHD